MNFKVINTSIGKLTIAAEGGHITHIFFEGEEPDIKIIPDTETAVLEKAAVQLTEYFDGHRKVFDLPLKPAGGAFFQKIWKTMIREVTYGATISYSGLAELADNPKAARAVGMANNRNPIPIIIPCHRVVGKDDKLVGFRAGVCVKEKLLAFERGEKQWQQ